MTLLEQGFWYRYLKRNKGGMESGSSVKKKIRWQGEIRPANKRVKAERKTDRNMSPAIVTPFFLPYFTTRVLIPAS